jgi:hypothetical protein
VAADLDLTDASQAAAPLQAGRWAGAALAMVGLLVIVAGLTGWAAVTLLGSVVVGAGLTYLSGLPLTLEERLAYGTVLGALAVTLADFLLAMVFGLTLATVLAGLVAALGLSAVGWRRAGAELPADVAEAAARWRRREPWPLWALLAVCWPFTLLLLGRSYTFTAQGLITGNAGAYADWAAHLTYAGSFAFGRNFPPQFPVDPGHPLAYPFMIDLLAASLVPLGTSLTSSLVLSSGLLALAFPAVMYLAGLRLVRSRGAAALAVLVFTMSGGLGFLSLLDDVRRSGLAALTHPAHFFTQDAKQNYQWLNPVLAWLVPQRSVLFGFCLTLLVMAMLWMALRSRDRLGWRPFAFAGTAAGLTPLFHLHAYGTILALSIFWAVFAPRREWTTFFAPALILGLPPVLWMLGGGAASLRVQVWWLANTDGHSDGPIWFWLKNTSLLVPAMAAAFLWRPVLPRRIALHLAPIWLWFLVPNFLIFQPWDWDNTKFFAYWLLFGGLAVGALLRYLLGKGLPGRVGAYALVVLLMLSAALDLGRSLDPAAASSQFADPGGLRVAAWVRTNTPPTAVFLAAPEHNEPIPTLGGRRVMVGYPGWLWTYGLKDWSQRSMDARRMLKGDPATLDLLHRYHVDYVVLGPQELAAGADAGYFDEIGEPVYSSDGYTVYRVR